MSENTQNTSAGGKIRKNYSHKKADAYLDMKRQEAFNRQEKYNLLTLQEKIALAKSRRGESKRELTRLNTPPKKKETATIVPQVQSVTPPTEAAPKKKKYQKVKKS